jgi:hypothetical protein
MQQPKVQRAEERAVGGDEISGQDPANGHRLALLIDYHCHGS